MLFWVKYSLNKILFLKNLFFSIEHRDNPDPNKKRVYAVADGQYTYGPLSLFQYHNDEKYSKMYFFNLLFFKNEINNFYFRIRDEKLPPSLPCKVNS